MQYPIISLIIYFQYQTVPKHKEMFFKGKMDREFSFCYICPIEAPSVSVLEFYNISLFCRILLQPREVF